MAPNPDPSPFARSQHASADDWWQLASATLKGKPEAVLTDRMIEPGLAIPALMTTRERQVIPQPDLRRHWCPIAFVDAAQADASAVALADLQGGAGGLMLDFHGVPAADHPARLRAALEGVHVEMIELFLNGFHPSGLQDPAVQNCLGDAAFGSAGYDPFLAHALAAAQSEDPAAGQTGSRPDVLAVRWQEAGASAQHELAIALAAVAALASAGQGLDKTTIRLAITPDWALSLAKIRAFRRLWAGVASAFGEASARCHILACQSRRHLTVLDEKSNIMRATSAALGAAIGGADAILLLPFDHARGGGEALGRRIARSIHLILQDEAYMGQVADPAGGSFSLETLTDRLSRAAYQSFQAIEAAGGLHAAIAQGLPQSWCQEGRAARAAALAGGRSHITGVTHFQPGGETPAWVEFADDSPHLPIWREAAEFEAGDREGGADG